MINPEFEKELTNLLNRYCIENQSDTPDFILSEYLLDCLKTFNKTTNKRSKWYGQPGLTNACQVENSENTIIPKLIDHIEKDLN